MIIAEVTKTGTENVLSTIRKFSRRVQGTGVIKTIRAKRYFGRATSDATKKKSALKRIERRTERMTLIKEGKLTEAAPRRGFTHREPQTQNQSQQTKPAEGMPIAR